jgi:ATP-dependent RNA helicase DDX19/DBP5
MPLELTHERDAFQAICLAPSRELARQIEVVIQTMGKFLPLKTFLAVKDGWDRSTRVTAQVVVGTPGTVTDMIGKRALDVKGVKVLVLDEADDMLDIQGLGDHTLRIKK